MSSREHDAIPLCKIDEDWTVRAVIAGAAFGERSKSIRHRLHLGNPGVEVGDVFLGDRLYFPTRAIAIPPERQQMADFLDRKT